VVAEMRTREAMIRYLLSQTRYTIEELNALDDATIYQWYKEEKEVDKE
jgi:hypothetical protein